MGLSSLVFVTSDKDNASGTKCISLDRSHSLNQFKKLETAISDFELRAAQDICGSRSRHACGSKCRNKKKCKGKRSKKPKVQCECSKYMARRKVICECPPASSCTLLKKSLTCVAENLPKCYKASKSSLCKSASFRKIRKKLQRDCNEVCYNIADYLNEICKLLKRHDTKFSCKICCLFTSVAHLYADWGEFLLYVCKKVCCK